MKSTSKSCEPSNPTPLRPRRSRLVQTSAPSRPRLSCLVPILALSLLLTGCTLTPPGTTQEQAALRQAGELYEIPIERRELPAVPLTPDWRDVLHRAFLANGDLEAAYYEWQAAMARVQIASAYPNSNLMFSYSYMFSRENMKAWNRTTLGVGFDPAMPLQLPQKVEQAGRVALEDARARGRRFQAAKFELQEKILAAWLEHLWIAQRIVLAQENLELLRMLLDTAGQRLGAGGAQQDLLKAQTAYELARNDLANLQSELQSARAMLNGLMGRKPEEPLLPSDALPAWRVIPADDATLLALGVDNHPQLQALAHDVAGRADALQLARMAWIPDINLDFSITGSISQMIGAAVMLPTNLPKIRGSIAEAQAIVKGTEAMLRQLRSERAASYIATLYAMRNSERQVTLFDEVILPKAQQMLSSSLQAYAGGTLEFADLVDSQRTLLDIRMVMLEAWIAREKRLAELEALAGVDIESLAPAAPAAPAQAPSIPASPPAKDHHHGH